MGPRARQRRSFRHAVNCDLELRPLMNVFIVLIPMLLMSAVFMEIRVIEMTLPEAALASESAPAAEPFDLAIHIEPTAYVVTGGGAVLASVPREAAAAGSAVPSEAASALLSSTLAGIAAAHPGAKEVRIVAGARTRYQELVGLMDLVRGAGLPQAALEGADTEGV